MIRCLCPVFYLAKSFMYILCCELDKVLDEVLDEVNEAINNATKEKKEEVVD